MTSTWTRVAFVGVLLAGLVIAGCGATLTDAQRVWCAGQPLAVLDAGDTLDIYPSTLVVDKAIDAHRAAEDGVTAILEDIADDISATPGPSDPNAGYDWAASWERDDADGFTRACLAAWEIR